MKAQRNPAPVQGDWLTRISKDRERREDTVYVVSPDATGATIARVESWSFASGELVFELGRHTHAGSAHLADPRAFRPMARPTPPVEPEATLESLRRTVADLLARVEYHTTTNAMLLERVSALEARSATKNGQVPLAFQAGARA
jgi:hypothetical protein